MFHCNWLTPEGNVVNATPMKHSFHIFLPDPKRKYDFDTNTSYNNRTIYLDSYAPLSIERNPARNVTYFTAGPYSSRDKIFERYSIPNSASEALQSLPGSMMHLSGGILKPSKEGKEWLSLRYTIDVDLL